jgi:tRNA(fMet)-specific endonuclease VapC
VYLLDTDTCIWLLQMQPAVSARAAMESPANLAVATMTVSELWYGALRGTRSTAFSIVRRFLATDVQVLPFDTDAAYRHAEIRHALRAQPIGPRDLEIASVAVACGLTVVTGNVREFSRVPGLQVESWM